MQKTKGSREKDDYVVLHENYNINLKQGFLGVLRFPPPIKLIATI